MKNIIEQRVFYADTDAYRVVWHGAYLRWLERGRVELCEMLGHDLKNLEEQDILLPVTNLNIKYKMSARLNDVVVIETEITKFNGLSATFKQYIRLKSTGKLLIEADVDIVAISHSTGKLYRRMPEVLAKSFDGEVKCLQHV